MILSNIQVSSDFAKPTWHHKGIPVRHYKNFNYTVFNPSWVYRLGYIHKNYSFVEEAMDEIKLYNILRTDLKLSDDKAADFVSAIGKTAERELDVRIQTLATKNDLRELSLATKNDLRELSLVTKNDIQELSRATKNDIQELSLATKNDIRELSLATKNDIRDLYKTIYLTSLFQFIAIVASVLAIVKFMR
jgi:hypothetical protein